MNPTSPINLLHDHPEVKPAFARLLLAHGAGAPMTSPFMTQITELLTARGVAVSRFEFAYMAARKTDHIRRPPPRAERLIEEYATAVELLNNDRKVPPLPLLIGGKSMGGRIATMVADDLFKAGTIKAAVALGYPFHPPQKTDKLRTAHLQHFATPLLIVQGDRDPFGTRNEVISYKLSSQITFAWITQGNHDLKPPRGAPTNHETNLNSAADAIANFALRFKHVQ